MSSRAVTPRLGELIRQRHIARGLTQAQFGERVGVEQHTVSGWERGGFHPLRKHMRPLAEALGVDLTELLEEWAG